MKKVLVVLAVIILGMAGSVWADQETFTSKATVVGPTAISMTISYWTGHTAPNGVIDFNLDQIGTPVIGKTSWLDDGGDDGWTSKDANVGFTAICIAPAGTHSFKVTCGQMKQTGGIYSIPYGSGDVDYFGVRVKQDGLDVPGWGTDSSMRRHSLTVSPPIEWGGTDTGHEYSVFNLLKIPTNAPAGSYATTSDTPGDPNQHLIVEFI